MRFYKLKILFLFKSNIFLFFNEQKQSVSVKIGDLGIARKFARNGA